jgi:hypothetical protein
LLHIFFDLGNAFFPHWVDVSLFIDVDYSLGVTSMEEASFFDPLSTHPEESSLLEELVETLVLTIVMLLWKGITNVDDEAWIVRIASLSIDRIT